LAFAFGVRNSYALSFQIVGENACLSCFLSDKDSEILIHGVSVSFLVELEIDLLAIALIIFLLNVIVKMGTMKTIFRRNTCRTRISYNITFKLKNKIKNPFPDFCKTTPGLRIRLATSFHSTLIAKSAFQKWNPEIHSQ
jgi:hypothetical protein